MTGAPPLSISIAGGSVWAVPACVDPARCSSTLEAVSPTGLTPLPDQPPGRVDDVARVGGHAEALVELADYSSALAVTSDGGASWQQHPLPAQFCGFALGYPLTAAPDGTLYLVCAGGAAAGNEPKRLYDSTDDGETWQDLGALETYGYADSIQAATATLLWRYGGRAPLYVSTDAGRSWHAQLSDAIGDAAGTSLYAFAASGDQALAFVVNPQARSDGSWSINEYRTTDAGRTWQTEPIRP